MQILDEWIPDGTWKHSPLLRAYLADHYCLQMRQVEELDIYLSQQVESEAANQRYKQLSILGL
jgi:hypothetical protein